MCYRNLTVFLFVIFYPADYLEGGEWRSVSKNYAGNRNHFSLWDFKFFWHEL